MKRICDDLADASEAVWSWFSIPLGLMILVVSALPGDAAPPGRHTEIKPFQRELLKLDADDIAEIGPDAVPLGKGGKVDLALLEGKVLPEMEILDFRPGKKPNTIQLLTFKPIKGIPRVPLNTIESLTIGGVSYELAYDRAGKNWVLFDQARRDAAAKERLAAVKAMLRPEPDEQQIERGKQFIESIFEMARKQFPEETFRTEENEEFLIFANLPQSSLPPLLRGADRVSACLHELLAIPKDRKLWVGKCVLVVFDTKENFDLFESKSLKTENPEPYGSSWHYSRDSGAMFVTSYFENGQISCSQQLGYAISICFLNRFRSTVIFPNWLDMGLATLVSSSLYPESGEFERNVQDDLPNILKNKHLNGMMRNDDLHIGDFYFGAAGQIAKMLFEKNPSAYRSLFWAIKDGYTQEEALELTYDMTVEEVAAAYGKLIGVPRLKP